MEARKMPKYKSHKEVWALKIKKIIAIEREETRNIACNEMVATITPEEQGFIPFDVDFEYVNKHNPKAGGYYVVYEGGYKSFSPADAFEGGYSSINTTNIY